MRRAGGRVINFGRNWSRTVTAGDAVSPYDKVRRFATFSPTGSGLGMAAAQAAYLVVRRDDGYGDVYPLAAGVHYTLGRAATNRVVLKDELCSREHAEVYLTDGHWYVRDLDSLNGTRLNGLPVTEERALEPQDEVQVGRT